jgi:hypothetical protein
LTTSENLAVRKNIFVLSGVVDETMLYQISGEGVKVRGFDHRDNTFFNRGQDIPIGGLADPNREPGFSKEDPKLPGGVGNDFKSWMATGRSKVKGRGVS